MIKYKNGSKDVFNQNNQPSASEIKSKPESSNNSEEKINSPKKFSFVKKTNPYDRLENKPNKKNNRWSHWISSSIGPDLLDGSHEEPWQENISRYSISSEINYLLRFEINKNIFLSMEPGLFFKRKKYEYENSNFDTTSFDPNYYVSNRYTHLLFHTPLLFNLKKGSFSLNFGIDIIYPFGYSSISYSSNYGTSKGSNFGKQYSVGDILGLIGSNYRLNDKNEIGLNFGFSFKEEPYFNSSLYRSGYYFGFIRLKYSHKFSKSEK
tara:strand:- start:349 stop:1143 length:795 start_codon:yes stop_codon:yes gene_type:complete